MSMATPEQTRKRDKQGAYALMASVALALIIANTPLDSSYQEFLLRPLTIGIAPLSLTKNVLHWINDGLMAIFFLLVGIEIKREVLVGDLSTVGRALLPAIAAVGGMLLPALVYAWFNRTDATLRAGWAIPTATDIAFAVGVLALLGARAPASLRIFLLALAVIDDLGAIVLIAVLFTEKLSWLALGCAAISLAVLITLNRCDVRRVTPYVLAGIVLWLSVLKSGVHATLAGVVLGLAIPLTRSGEPGVARRLENKLHPWVAFVILPLFALANAGIPLANASIATLKHPVTLGVGLGLLLGKLVGVLGFTWLAVRFGFGSLPQGVQWRHVTGVALLTGIGFTMSLFLGSLAFPDDSLHGQVRLGVLLGSAAAALAGALWLAVGDRRTDRVDDGL
jgi:NhaA family Na+:H+ antiporter